MPVRKEILEKKFWEINKNKAFQTGEADITSEEFGAMVGSIKRYGLGGECQKILSTQDPDSYADLISYFPMGEDERSEAAAAAGRIERFISLSDKVYGSIYRGITFNSAHDENGLLDKTLSKLKVGETIEMGHISSWTTNKGTARSYARGSVDMEFEDGENYAIVYSVKANKSAVSLGGINPEGECLTPKSASYRVSGVKKSYDTLLECHTYEVELEEN